MQNVKPISPCVKCGLAKSKSKCAVYKNGDCWFTTEEVAEVYKVRRLAK
jgi:hypothetical protein